MKAQSLSEELNHTDTDHIDELMALFNMHNLIPELSKHEHVFATSLAMLVTSLHWSGNIRHLFESLPYTKGREIDLLDILNTMANLGFSSHNMIMTAKEIDDRLMPCLFIPEEGGRISSPLVLLSKKDNTITAFHSAKREKIEFIDEELSGSAYFFEKINPEEIEEDVQTKKSAGLTWFKITFDRFRPVIREIVISSVLINIFALAMPLFIMSIYDRVIGTASTVTLKELVLGVLIAVIAESTLRMFRLRSTVWLGVRLDNIVSNAIFERLLYMKAAYTEGASISAQISRIKTFESVRKFFTGPLFTVIVELPFTVILLAAIWTIAGPLVYIPIVVVLLFILMLSYYKSKIRVGMRAAARASSHRQQFGMETFIKMHALYQNGMSRNWWKQYKEELSKSSYASFNSSMISATIESAAHAISIMSGVAVVSFGVHLVWAGQLTIGALVATMIFIWRILAPLQTLCSMLPRVEQLQNSIDQINKLMNIETERSAMILKRPIEHLEGRIKITNVGLRYSADVEPLFVGFDLEVARGEVIALTGVNGSGKTSILKLINGLYRSQTGTIRIDGTNIKQMEPIELRNYIAYLPQVPNFFEGTIKENLLLANPLVTDDDLKVALKESKVEEQLKTLDLTVDTIIGANNLSLPSDLIYELNLTRVFLKKKSTILLLDELPNAVLNGPAGEAYKNLIVSAKGNKTVFFISQRNDFIKLADKVVLLRIGNKPLIMKPDEFLNQYGQ